MESAAGLDNLSRALADRYEIDREIGQGGMATVYLARDVRHDRKVAVKVLRPELSAILGAERFLKEIRLTANLQHPHILPLHDSGTADGTVFYVMPYVEGESLRQRIARERQLPVAESVRIACEVASALDYAHRHGVIHRDIKPENILLHDGQALVADFGIALAASTASDGTRMTETGMSLGTPHYMSPEQAMGERDITARSDVYALGCVLYEMLVGEPPFTGPTAQAIVARVVTEEPRSLRLQRKTIPANVEAAVETALSKMPADRFASAAQFADALGRSEYVAAQTRASISPASAAHSGLHTRALTYAPWLVAAVAVAIAAWTGTRDVEEPVSRERTMLWQASTPVNVLGRSAAISTDGNSIAFVDTVGGRQQIWIKDRDRLDAVAVAGTAEALAVAFSPDAQWIVFSAGGKIKKVPRVGGSAIVLADSAGTAPALAWLDDGTVLFGDAGVRLYAVSENGGPRRKIYPTDSSVTLGVVHVTGLPGSRAALITTCSPGCSDAALHALDLRSGKTSNLAGEALKGWYVDGNVVFVRRDGGVFAAPFDEGDLTFSAAPVPVLNGVRTGLQVPDMAVSPNGTLLYIAGDAQAGALLEPVYVDRRGMVTPVDSGWSFVLPVNGGFELSPDGRRLAVGARLGGSEDIWIKELDNGPLRRLTFDGASARPRWSSDGVSIMYTSTKGGGSSDLRRRHADGTGAEETLFDLPRPIFDVELTPDPAVMLVRLGQPPSRDITSIRVGTKNAAPLLASGEYDEVGPDLSPDGRWLAYASNESGRYEVYVRPYPDVNAGKWQVSRNGGTEPLWARNGRELFYRGEGHLMSAAVVGGSAFAVGAPARLFRTQGRQRIFPTARLYDVTPDGRRFLFLQAVDEDLDSRAQPVIRVDNWMQEVRHALRGRK